MKRSGRNERFGKFKDLVEKFKGLVEKFKDLVEIKGLVNLKVG